MLQLNCTNNYQSVQDHFRIGFANDKWTNFKREAWKRKSTSRNLHCCRRDKSSKTLIFSSWVQRKNVLHKSLYSELFLKEGRGKLSINLKNLDKEEKLHGNVSSVEVIENLVNSLICSKPSLKVIKLHDLTVNMVSHLQIAILFFRKPNVS